MSDLDALPVKPPAKQSEAFRKEQLKKWEASETATVSSDIKSKRWAVQFPLELLFLSACEGGDVEYARELLHMGVNINAKNCDGLAALHQATVNTDEDMMQFLIENDADLDIFDNEGWTPLHAAASVGSIAFVELLIEKGANPVAVNHDGDTPFDLVKSDGDTGVREYLQQVIEDAGIDLLEWKQAEENQMRDDATKWLKERDRAKANQKHPETGATPLHVAASKNFVDVMRILLRSGADPDAMDNDKWTPLHAAAHWSLADAAKVLTEYGANFGLENKNGHTAKDLAENEMLTILQQLEQQQQDLIEARKCNSDEIEDSLSRPINPNPTRRSSVVRSSMIDSGNMKQKDKELEKIEIRKQASDPLPTIPPTPVTPSDDSRIMPPTEIIPTRGPEPSRGFVNDESLLVTTKDAEVASVSSDEEGNDDDDELTTNVEDVTADNDDTGSMISSISSSVREPAPESSEVAASSNEKPAGGEKDTGMGGAFDEIVKELEQSDRSASETSVPAEEKMEEEAPKVKSRVDRIETVPLRGASVKIQMPFNRALQSSDSVPLPEPKTTVSRKLKEPEEPPVPVVVSPPLPVVEVVKTDSIETISNTDKLDPTPDVIKQVEERPKKPPLTGVNLLNIEDADSIVNNKKSEENKDAKKDLASTLNEDETSAGGLKRTASWRVKKGKDKEAAKEKEVEKPSPPVEAKVEDTTAIVEVEKKEEVEKSESEAIMPPSAVSSSVTITDTTQATPPTSKVEESESDQVTPKSSENSAILLPKSEEKEITRKQRARFERSTRRSTQGVSAADLESALASPHSHAIREDKKEERQRIESKLMPSSPAVVSPTPQGSSTVLPPGANPPSQLRPHSHQPPPNQLEVGFQRSSRYARLTSRDVDEAITRQPVASQANASKVGVPPININNQNRSQTVIPVGSGQPTSYVTQTSLSPSPVAVNLNSSSYYNFNNNPPTNRPLTTTNPSLYTMSHYNSSVPKTALQKSSVDHFDGLRMKTAEGDYKSAFTPTQTGDYKNYTVVNIGGSTGPGSRTGSDYANVQVPATSSVQSAVAVPKPYKPMVFTQSKPISSTPPIPGPRKKPTEYVAVSVPFSSTGQHRETIPKATSSGGAMYPGYTSSNLRGDSPGDYFEMRSISFDSAKPPKPGNISTKPSSGPMPSKPYSSTSIDAGHQRRDVGYHHHHPSATPPIASRTGYVRYTPSVAPVSEKPSYGISSDPYHKSYSDRSLDAYFKEGTARYSFSPPSIESSFAPKYGGGSGSAMNLPLGGNQSYQFTHPVIMSGSARALPPSASGYRSPPGDPKGLLRTSSLKDRPHPSMHHSTYTKY